MWKEYAKAVHASTDVLWVTEHFFANSGEMRDHSKDDFWPFRYDYNERDGVPTIHVHFGSLGFKEPIDLGPGLLSKERYEEQRDKLRAMFTEIKHSHPQAKIVRGRSWLYNVEAYRRLYPAEYSDSRVLSLGGFNGGGRWGQFRNGDGTVNRELSQQFLQNITHLERDNLEAAFPIQTWSVSAPIEAFYKEYGIE
jgi:hypothetical protein